MRQEAGEVSSGSGICAVFANLERLKAYSVQYEARKEKRLWRDRGSMQFIRYNWRASKEEMNNIRKSYGFSGTSSLRKAELAAQLVELCRRDTIKCCLPWTRKGMTCSGRCYNSGLLKARIYQLPRQNLLNSCLLPRNR